MHHIANIVTSLFRPSFDAAALTTIAESLDHPCLAMAGHGFIGNLPLPGLAVGRDGSVRIVDGQ